MARPFGKKDFEQTAVGVVDSIKEAKANKKFLKETGKYAEFGVIPFEGTHWFKMRERPLKKI
jgi:hypothetical protein